MYYKLYLTNNYIATEVYAFLMEYSDLAALRILALLIIRAVKRQFVKINGVALYAPALRDTPEIHTNDVFEVIYNHENVDICELNGVLFLYINNFVVIN